MQGVSRESDGRAAAQSATMRTHPYGESPMATLVQRSCSCMMAWGVLHQKPSKGPHIPPSCSSRGLCQPVGRGHCLSELEATKAEARQAGSLNADHTRRLPKHTELTRNRPQDPIGTLRVADWLVWTFVFPPLFPPLCGARLPPPVFGRCRLSPFQTRLESRLRTRIDGTAACCSGSDVCGLLITTTGSLAQRGFFLYLTFFCIGAMSENREKNKLRGKKRA